MERLVRHVRRECGLIRDCYMKVRHCVWRGHTVSEGAAEMARQCGDIEVATECTVCHFPLVAWTRLEEPGYLIVEEF